MARRVLGEQATAAVYQAVSALFARLSVRLLGRTYGDKVISFGARFDPVGHRADLSLPGVFDAASKMHGVTPDGHLREAMMRGVEGYLGAYKERTYAQVLQNVQASLLDAERRGMDLDPMTVLGGQLGAIWGRVRADVVRLVGTEATRVRNAGSLDALSRVNAMTGGGPDEVVAFLGPSDQHTCKECLRLFFLPDRVTPRCWRLSEVGNGFHKVGDPGPKVGGCHPNCRHTVVAVRDGYGFRAGKLVYVGPEHRELVAQRG